MEANTTIAVTEARAALSVCEQSLSESGMTVQKVVLGVVGTVVVGLLLWWLHCLDVADQAKAKAIQDKVKQDKDEADKTKADTNRMTATRNLCDHNATVTESNLCSAPWNEEAFGGGPCAKCHKYFDYHGITMCAMYRWSSCERSYCGDCAAVLNRQVDMN